MVPWQKLPDDLQKAVLALVLFSGSGAIASCCRPMVCDPAPPPRMTPTPTMTPMICDPAPPPSLTPTPTITPMICDPAPPPAGKPTMTPMICDPPPRPPDIAPEPSAEVALPGFEARNVQVMPDQVQEGIEVRGRVTDREGNPWREVRVALIAPGIEISSRTDRDGAYALRFNRPGSYQMFLDVDKSRSVPLYLKLHDLATVDWVAVSTESRSPLPLAEIRTVVITQVAADAALAQGVTLAAASPWPGAAYEWTVTGGTLVKSGPHVTWQPPAAAGRYLLQVIADWDYAGLAVDAVVLTVTAGGQVRVS